jgi:succinoglycan biosynthesis transport protein ExoP
MQEVVDRHGSRAPALTPHASYPLPERSEVERLLAAARRQISVIAVGCIIGLILGVGYLATAVPLYTASAQVLLDHKRLRAVQESYGDVMTLGVEGASPVDSQVEVLRSDSVVHSVVDRLQLVKDKEFRARRPSVLSLAMAEVRRMLGFAPPAVEEVHALVDEETERRQVGNMLRGGLGARRLPRTLVLEISYTSPIPSKAMAIANGFADAYLNDQLEAKYDANRRASDWLQNRLAELKQQAMTSDLAVQRFKASQNLTITGGRSIDEQQLGEVNTQLVTARAETAKQEARYHRMRTILDGRQMDAVVSEAIGNTVIEQLRQKFVAAAKREADLSSKLGPDHGSVITARNDMREYERLMFDELGRIAELYRSELDIARSREKALEGSLKGLVGTTASANEALVALRELERESEIYKKLYQSFLQRNQELIQQQSFPITEARVILNAQMPFSPTHPQRTRVLLLMMVLGGGLGVCVAALREFRERAFRTGEQIRAELGLEFLGMLPAMKAPASKPLFDLPSMRSIFGRKRRGKLGRRKVVPEAGSIEHEKLAPVMRYAVDEPLSAFAETLRAVKIAADLTLPDRSTRVIGVTSVLPGEGKSTIAMNFASLLSNLGNRTLLIDGDLRNPGLTRAVAPEAKAGIIEAVLEGKPFKSLLVMEEASSLSILPAVLHGRVPHTSDFLVSAGMKAVLKQAIDEYTFIVIDLPPLGPVVDVRAVAPQLDAILFVVEWGETARTLVRDTLGSHHIVRDKCLGVVLNKVTMSRLKLYEHYGPEDYYTGRYAKYYHHGA